MNQDSNSKTANHASETDTHNAPPVDDDGVAGSLNPGALGEPAANHCAEADFAEPDSDAEIARQARDFGAKLRAEREQAKWSQQEAAAELHLPVRILEKLEAGDWDSFQDAIYLRGYLRSYCRLLGLAEPDLDIPARLDPPALVSTGGISRGRFLFRRYATAAVYLFVTALVVVPLVVLGLNQSLRQQLAGPTPLSPPGVQQPGADEGLSGASNKTPSTEHKSRTLMASIAPIGLLDSKSDAAADEAGNVAANVNDSSADSAGKARTSVATPSADEPLVIKLAGPCWVEVSAADGSHLEYALLDAGQYTYRHSGGLTVRLGNAGAAQVLSGGQALDVSAYKRSNVAYFRIDKDGKLQAPPAA